jgi:hypothetical protein
LRRVTSFEGSRGRLLGVEALRTCGFGTPSRVSARYEARTSSLQATFRITIVPDFELIKL